VTRMQVTTDWLTIGVLILAVGLGVAVAVLGNDVVIGVADSSYWLAAATTRVRERCVPMNGVFHGSSAAARWPHWTAKYSTSSCSRASLPLVRYRQVSSDDSGRA
jgi:hypothetical protein